MRKIIFLILVLWAANPAVKAQSEAIEWTTDFKAAQALARETHRPMLIDFTAVWCKPCKEMEKTFWVSPEVVQAVKSFVAVKIDTDRSGTWLAKYGGGGIPLVVFTDHFGNMITFRRGFGDRNRRDLNQIISELPKDYAPVKDAFKKLELDKNDSPSLLVVADFYSKSKMATLANSYYDRALKTGALKNDAAQKERIAYTVAANYYLAQLYAEAARSLNDYLKNYPSTRNREASLSMLAISCARLGIEEEALKYLDLVKKEFPESKNILTINQTIEYEKLKKDKK